jgi:hypothetical protein
MRRLSESYLVNWQAVKAHPRVNNSITIKEGAMFETLSSTLEKLRPGTISHLSALPFTCTPICNRELVWETERTKILDALHTVFISSPIHSENYK